MTDPTFNLSLDDARFVVGELPYYDEFTKDLQRWIDAEEARLEEKRQRDEEAWERIEPIWNRFIWRAVGVRFEEVQP